MDTDTRISVIAGRPGAGKTRWLPGKWLRRFAT